MNYKHLYLLLVNGIILGIYLLLSQETSYAQNPTPTPPPLQVPTDNLTPPTQLLTPTAVSTGSNDSLVSPNFTPTPQSRASFGGTALTLNLAELGYEDVAIAGPLGEAEFYLHIPSYWNILPGSSFVLHYIPEMGLLNNADPFELQVLFNNEIIYRTVIRDVEEQSLNIPLPEFQSEHGQAQALEILLRSPENCEVESFGLLKIFSDSFFNLNYQTTSPLLDLAYYPSPIYERTFFTQTAHIVLPDQPAPLALEGALSLGARLGQLTGNELILTTTMASALDPANLPDEHLIVVGTPENNSILSYLSDVSPLPAPIQQRRLQLSSTGPDLIIPGTLLTHTLYITNNEANPVSDLGVDVRLPAITERVSCQPECQRVNNTIHWDIDTLQPDATSTVTLSLAYPPTSVVETADLSFEMKQNKEIINVNTVSAPVVSEGDPDIIEVASSSPFFFTFEDRAVPETDGIIQFIPSPRWPNKAILLVTGLTDEAVYKAGYVLGTQPDLLGMKGQVMLVQNIIGDENDAQANLSQNLTFADLGYEDRLLTGVTSRDILYQFKLPINWRLTSEAAVSFDFSHSPLLDPSRSAITLLFNGTPIGSAALDESNAITGQLRALLPPEKVRVGRWNNLIARVEMEALSPCINAASSQIWANLKASSSLDLPHTLDESVEQFDLDLLPAPFVRSSNLSDVIFALPEAPSNVEYDAAIKTVSYLGSQSDGISFQPLALLGNPDDIDLSNSHLILIGRPSRNLMLQEINESLPQPFVPGTDTIRPQIDKIVFRLPDNLDLGYLQLIPSSWSEKRAVLALSGTSDLGLTWATQMVAEPEKTEQLEGNVAMAPNHLEIYTADTRELATGGKMAVVVTAVPETVILGTATPTPPPPTQTPVAPVEGAIPNPPSASIPALPDWVPYAVGGGIALIFIILGIAYWQSRHQSRLGI